MKNKEAIRVLKNLRKTQKRHFEGYKNLLRNGFNIFTEEQIKYKISVAAYHSQRDIAALDAAIENLKGK